jgi:hypothetical protein
MTNPILFAAASVFLMAASAPPALASDPLAALSWMAGQWSGEEGGVKSEERWTEPAGGMMLAVHRDVAGGKAVHFEFLRIESTPEGIVYFASPRGKAPTPFKMVESSKERVVFENAEHEYPRRILYWLANGEMHARIEGTPGGKAKSEEWVWKLVSS